MVIGDKKFVCIPFDATYSVRIIGNNEGTMDFVIQDVCQDENGVYLSNTARFDSVNLYKRKVMECNINPTEITSNLKLFVLDTNGKVVREILEDGFENDFITNENDKEKSVSNNDSSSNDLQTVNQPSDLRVEIRDDYRISYFSAIPFWGKKKPKISNFGKITVSDNTTTYDVTKIKVNKKKQIIQITGLSGANKTITKKIKKATKGLTGLPFTIKPYKVRNTDNVKTKFKGEILKAVKVTINGKDYKAKKKEFSYDSSTRQISFKGENLAGNYTCN